MIWPFRRLTPVGRVLRRARWLLYRHGWGQGRVDGIYTPGSYCAAYAIQRASYKSKTVEGDVAMLAFAEHNELPKRYPDYNGTQRTTSWNDTLGRSRAEVIAAFKKAEAKETIHWP